MDSNNTFISKNYFFLFIIKNRINKVIKKLNLFSKFKKYMKKI